MKVLAIALCLLALSVCARAQSAAPASPVATPAASKLTSDARDAGDVNKSKPASGKSNPAKLANGSTNDAPTRSIRTTAGTIMLPAEKSQPVRIPRLDKPPVIDGKLDDEVWKRAASFKDFYQVQPGDNIAPSKPSEAFIAYDSKYLYLAFHAYDDPS